MIKQKYAFFRGILSICSVEPRTLATKVLIFNVKSVVFHRIQSCSECSCRKNFISFFYTLKASTTTTRNKKCYWGLFYSGFNEKSRKKCSSQLTLHLLKEKVYLVKQWILNSGKILFCKKRMLKRRRGFICLVFSSASDFHNSHLKHRGVLPTMAMQ